MPDYDFGVEADHAAHVLDRIERQLLTVEASFRALDAAVAAVFKRHGGWWWDGSGANPYVPLLALADAIVVTADSTNMIGEAAATGAPILVFEPHGGHARLAKFLEALKAYGAVHHFEGRLEGGRYEPLDSTEAIARAVDTGFRRHRAATGLD